MNTSAAQLALVAAIVLIPAALVANGYGIRKWLVLAILAGPLGIFAFVSAAMAAHRGAPIGRHFVLGMLLGPIGNLVTAVATRGPAEGTAEVRTPA